MKTVLLAATISHSFRQYLSERYEKLIEINQLDDLGYDVMQSIQGIVTSNKLILNTETLGNFPSLKWIARLGSGMEIIDLGYCQQHKIHCFSSPKGIANSVAEHTVGMLLSLRHHIISSYEEIKNKQWIREPNRGLEIESLTLGIIGFGHTGQAFAHKMKHFVKSIIAYDKYKTNFGNEFVQAVDLNELKAKATIISLHIPLNEETIHFYNQSFINSVKQPHIFINTSRGKVANTHDVIHGLATQKITGACLDVLEEENNIQDTLKKENNVVQQLLNYPVIVTPHIAGYSHDAIEKMSEELRIQIETVL